MPKHQLPRAFESTIERCMRFVVIDHLYLLPVLPLQPTPRHLLMGPCLRAVNVHIASCRRKAGRHAIQVLGEEDLTS